MEAKPVESHDEILETDGKNYESNGNVTIPASLLEKLYLDPRQQKLSKVFGNPSPIPLLGFLVSSVPLGCALMGWRGAGGGGTATIGVTYFFGGMIQIIGAVMEWIIGNTFPCIVFMSYGAFWLALGATQQPIFNAEGSFTANATTAAETADGVAQFYSSFAFFLLAMAILTLMYTIIALRINCVYVLIFFCVDLALWLLTASYWKLAEGKSAEGETLQKAAGAFVFVFCMLAFYLLFDQLCESVDWPLSLPMGDLSARFNGRSSRLAKDRPDETLNV